MADAPQFYLTGKQMGRLKELLEDFEPHIIERGEPLRSAQAVSAVKWDGEEEAFRAVVRGGKKYHVLISIAEHDTSAECSCPYSYDCKHAAAVLSVLLDACAVEKVEKPKTSTKAAEKPQAPAGSLRALLEEKLGQPLDEMAGRFIAQAETLWQIKKSTVAGAKLSEMAGRQHYWGFGQLRMWPDAHPPQDGWEFLACLLAAMDTQHLHAPPQVLRVLDKNLRHKLMTRWRRMEDIETWRKQLGAWRDPVPEEAAAAPELRLLLLGADVLVQIRQPGQEGFAKATQKVLKQLTNQDAALDAGSGIILRACRDHYGSVTSELRPMSKQLTACVAQLISTPQLMQQHLVNVHEEPLEPADEPLRWDLQPPPDGEGDYELRLLNHHGLSPPAPACVTAGVPPRYVTSDLVYELPGWPFDPQTKVEWPMRIPAAALETKEGVSALAKLGLPVPQRLAGRVEIVKPEITVRCRVHRYPNSATDYFQLQAKAVFPRQLPRQFWSGSMWLVMHDPRATQDKPQPDAKIIQPDRSLLPAVAAWLGQMPVKPAATYYSSSDHWQEQRIQGKDWPQRFIEWLDGRPKGFTVELDAELASLRDGIVAGSVRLDIEESKTGIDWFDLSVSLQVSDTTLSQEEIDLLLKAKGRWVKLGGKGWRKLEFQLSEAQQSELAELGLAVNDFSAEKQSLHALQLGAFAHKKSSLLASERVEQVRRRVEEIQTRVTPPLPSQITATLRPYQMEGFHFLAYLTANRFGGVLADDMGLGKTLQTLAWIAWLRGELKTSAPALVVCPKSVQGNWLAEARKFFPSLRVEVWSRATAGQAGLDGTCDLLVIHYAQLRLHEEALQKQKWSALVLDEAQAIKNPESQNARAAASLARMTPHRLALTGTPVENRLLDLWSIFAFAMPGVFGTRASFTKHFDGKDDPLARRRLAARTRPFLLRRTKGEVARDLPERIEEDLIVELEGTQAALYQAELKRARAQLLKAQTSKQLDQLRFNILTSLLRLRQICCDPRLIGLEAASKRKKAARTAAADSAKLSALLEQLEPLIEEGQKVLVFSQFVEMLGFIEQETTARQWTTFKLTGQTEHRDELVASFQSHEGSAVFLISLKAGGFGLNLTAASYVVLYDPWWNPAVEAQAIDRTHRIGQKQTVIAYRLLAQGTIEEKIRHLQKQKGQIAADILGEENFAQALTLNDFQFLLGDE